MDTLSGSSRKLPTLEELELWQDLRDRKLEAQMDSIESAIAADRPNKVWDTLAQIQNDNS